MPLVVFKKLVYACSPAAAHSYLKIIKSSDVGLRLAQGIFWSMAGSVISRGLMLLASIFVARMLGKTGYGELGMIQTTVGMLGVFAGFGLGLTCTKYVAEFRSSDPERAGRIIGLSGVFATGMASLMALGLFVFAPWLAEHAINAAHLTNTLRIGALILFVTVINGAQTGALAGFEAFKTIAHVNLLIGLISFPILISGAYFAGLEGAVWALAINLCFNWLLNHLALRKQARRYNVSFDFRNCSRELPILWQFSLPAVLAGSMVGPINWICRAMLVNHDGGYGEMGIFSATEQWFLMLTFLPSIFGSVLLPVLSNQLGENDSIKLKKTMLLAIKLNLFMIVPLVVAVSIASPYVMSMYGEGFVSGWSTLIVVLVTAGLVAVTAPVGIFIAASGKMWLGFVMNSGWALVFVVTMLFLVDLGALGLAISRLAAYALHSVWVFIFAFWLIKDHS